MTNDDRYEQLNKAVIETRELISFEDSLDQIEVAMQKHQKAVSELNEFLRSVWRVK